MEKNCLRQLEVLVNSFTFYPKHFFKKPLYKALWPKIRFFTWNCTPPVGQKNETAPKFFSRLFILELALSITKVSTRSECYTWDTSLVSFIRKSFSLDVLPPLKLRKYILPPPKEIRRPKQFFELFLIIVASGASRAHPTGGGGGANLKIYNWGSTNFTTVMGQNLEGGEVRFFSSSADSLQHHIRPANQNKY